MDQDVAAVARVDQRLARPRVAGDDDGPRRRAVRAAPRVEAEAERVRPGAVQHRDRGDAHVVVLVDQAAGRLGHGRPVGVRVVIVRLQAEEAVVDVLLPRGLNVP
ncbi:MAG: hypothetical protein OXI83_07190, partial [Gemmatimonadota bacterium]|nr:hypothetical protein [Gemmatimonadota bacterium]